MGRRLAIELKVVVWGFDGRKLESESTMLLTSIKNMQYLGMVATDLVTVVVAAKEKVKQAFADDLSSISSSPCEWFVCDDEKSATRLFVIQGSETLASW